MKYFLTMAIIAILTIGVTGADSKDRIPFALYPVARTQGADTKYYTFTSAISGESYVGFYHDRAVVTLTEVDRFGITNIELGAAPCAAFSMRFTKAGAAKLQEVMKVTPDVAFVVIIDGHCYSTVPTETLKPILDGDRKLIISVRGSSDDITRHLMQLVVEKLTPLLPKP